MGRGVFGTGIENGFWNSGGGWGKRRPDKRPEIKIFNLLLQRSKSRQNNKKGAGEVQL